MKQVILNSINFFFLLKKKPLWFSFRVLGLMFIFYGGVGTGFSQNFVPSIAPPEANSFAKFGEIPVGYYSGVPNISIPVYRLKDGSANLDISLRYHAAGIRVSEQASWVGLGWNLDVGGVITRNVKGKFDREECTGNYMNANYCGRLGSSLFPENYTVGYVTEPPELQQCLAENYNAGNMGYTMSSMCTQFWQQMQSCQVELCAGGSFGQSSIADGWFQPDTFSFNFMGYSGTCYYNFQENRFHVITNESFLKVEPIGTYLQMTGMKITSPDGIVYVFGTVQKKYSDPTSTYWGDISSEAFFLSEIQYPDGNYLKFDYTTISSVTQDLFNVSESYTYNGAQNSNPEGTVSNSADSYNPVYLSEINSPNVRITFARSAANQREDIKDSYFLSSISVLDKNTNKTRSFNFQYDYFTSSSVGGSLLSNTFLGANTVAKNFDYSGSLLTKRLKLVSFNEAGVKPYMFKYNETPLPYKTSAAVDHWGYYNGVNNTTLIPDLRNLTAILVSEQIPPHMLDLYNIGADRGPDSVFMKAAILEKVIYPTGGKTEFTYEPNKFSNRQILPANWQGQIIESYNFYKFKKGSDLSINMPDIFTPVAIAGSTDFTLNIHIKGHKGAYIGDITNYDVSPPKVYLQYERERELIKALKNATVTIVQYTLTGDFVGVCKTFKFDENLFNTENYADIDGSKLVIDKTFTLPRSFKYSLFVTCPYAYGGFDAYGGETKVEAKLFNTVRAPYTEPVSFGGGLRVKMIRNFTDQNDSEPATTKKYTYPGGGQLFLPLKYIKQQPIWYCGQPMPDGFYATTISNSNDFGTNLGSLGQYVGYSEVVEESLSKNNDTNGRTKYQYINEGLFTATSVVPTLEAKSNGYLAGVFTYDKNGVLLRSTENFFTYQNQDRYAGLVTTQYVTESACTSSGVMAGYLQHSPAYRSTYYYIYDANRINTYVVEKNFSGGLTNVKSTVYQHNALRQVISEATYNIDWLQVLNGTISAPTALAETKTYYPANPPAGYTSSDYTAMGNAYYLLPLKAEGYRNGAKVSEKTFNYSLSTFPTRLNVNVNRSSYLPANIIEKPTASAAVVNDKLSEFVFANGNIVQVKGPDGVPVTFIWDYNLSFPVAKIVNATYSSVAAQLGSCNSGCAGQINCDVKWNCIRSAFPNAQVTSYAYSAIDGVVSITDPNGRKSSYQYDSVSRLISILDHDGNYLRVFMYHYKD